MHLIHSDKERIVEGKLRSKELADHLKRTNSSNAVFLSEDASGVVKKIVYDAFSNQLIGIVLPFDEKTGKPKIFSFTAESPESIRKYIDSPQSTLVYIIVAQPLNRHSPPFILQIFGTNNTFKTDDVLNRWKFTIADLNK